MTNTTMMNDDDGDDKDGDDDNDFDDSQQTEDGRMNAKYARGFLFFLT